MKAESRQRRRWLWRVLPVLIGFIQIWAVNFAYYSRDHDWPPTGDEDPDQWRDAVGDASPWAYALAVAGPISLFWVRRWPRTVVGITATIALGYVALGYFALDLPGLPVAPAVVVALLGWVGAVRAERAEQTRRAEAAEAARTAAAERLGLAQELHDLLAHHISLINVQAGVALHLVDEKPEQTRTALAAIKGASKEALAAMRGALDTLRNPGEAAPRAPTDGLGQLEDLIESVRGAGVDVALRVDGARRDLAPAVDLTALRIVQESLTNVLRHSQAEHAWVAVDYREDDLRITVSDDGVGGAAVPGNGLTGMSERAAAVGGMCRGGPRRQGGFEVRAELPG
ncbi:MAG: sensor histidine kinase [Stackebrandtia sp.]